MSELRQRRGEGDGNDKVETAGESDHVLLISCFINFITTVFYIIAVIYISPIYLTG